MAQHYIQTVDLYFLRLKKKNLIFFFFYQLTQLQKYLITVFYGHDINGDTNNKKMEVFLLRDLNQVKETNTVCPQRKSHIKGQCIIKNASQRQ